MGEYILAYEGWSGICVCEAIDDSKGAPEDEEALYDFAEEQSAAVVREWVERYADEYTLVDYGHERTGLYGVTWALFRQRRER